MSQHVTNCLRSNVGRGMAAGVMVVAVHEVGHAVAALHCGAVDVHCWIAGERGRCNYSFSSSAPFTRMERIVIALAGPEAERVFTGSTDCRFWLWRDTAKVQCEIGRFMFAADDWLFNHAYREARKLVDDQWLTIRRHAMTLARMKTLTF